ncbi:MAG: nucleoside phosphorylase [Candidatus Adiutrix sp.]|jgi:uridine phosphorylase|nr:nucleoside phosphorylase [Candidatus Adiutrix sp.]
MTAAPDQEIAFTPAKNYPPLPPRGILAAAGFDLKILARAALPGLRQQPLLTGFTRLLAGTDAFWAGPVLGAPMAVMALESLIRRGAREIIFVGLAGSLHSDLAVGQLVCPATGLSTEGTSAHYPAPLSPARPLAEKILAAGRPGEISRGAIWSTDGIYRETAGLVESQRARGARTVDMETTALWAAAAFRQAQLAALVVISDVLAGREHYPGFHLPQFKSGLARAADIAWRALIKPK